MRPATTLHRPPSLRARTRATAIAAAATGVLAVALAIAGSAHARPARPDACRMGNVPAADIVARVPFETVGGRIYVQAMVNGGGPFRFAVDTGASDMARADATLVSRLGLPIEGATGNSDGMHAATTATVRIDTLRLGNLVRKDVEAITRDYRSHSTREGAFDGILARDFFADGLLVIDYPARTLTFSRKQALSPGDGNALAYERAFRVPVSIGGLRVEGNIDTGADIAFVVPKSLYDRLGSGPLQAAGRGDMANGKVDSWRATVHGPIRVGGAAFTDAGVRVVDGYPELLVGAQALQRSILLIDQRSMRVAVCPQG
jgi:predicted aspartyl protease